MSDVAHLLSRELFNEKYSLDYHRPSLPECATVR